MKPLLSIVTGTYQRLDFLRGMIDSVRRQLPPSISYEIVVVDGGSRDGTLDWCKQQADVRLIEQGQLLGAIKAFDAGAEAAQGDFVLLANDDILFHDGSIIRALSYLDSHPNCGAVAFADDRPAPNKRDGYGVQFLNAVLKTGDTTSVVYAQVGLYRRWLGDLCGWWGSRDETWGQFNTYGGDSRLSAEIWMRGYTVDAVSGVAAHDRIPPDDLRQHNQTVEQRIGSAYYRKYPNGVLIDSQPRPEQQQREHLRILYAPLFSPGYGRYKRGLCDSLSRAGVVYELDYVAYPERFIQTVAKFQPHLILTQFHGAEPITPEALAQARTYAPEAVVVNWNGDVYADQLTAPTMLELLREVDLQLVVNADVLPFYEREGIAAAYWQIGYEPVPDMLPFAPSHDLLFMATAYSEERKALEPVLRELAANVGLYGRGWELPSGVSMYDFARGAALYRNCKIAIGDNQYHDSAFVSNRLFEALANGAFLLHQHIPDLEKYTGLIAGVHYVEWFDFDDLRGKAESYLKHESERRKIAQQGEAFVRQYHSFDARVRELFVELLPKARRHDGRAEPVERNRPVLAQGELLDEGHWL